jgi:mono/diheme cytochrome c family protein
MRPPLTLILLLTACIRGQDTSPVVSDPRSPELGRLMFRIYCTPCHGVHAQGGKGPDLTVGGYANGDRDRDIFRVIARGVPGSEMPGYAGRVEDDSIWRIVAYLKSVANRPSVPVRGDAAAGEKIFWGKGGCGSCHQVGPRGKSIGPQLSRVGRQRSLVYLRASLLTPDADITAGFSTIAVVLPDGRKITGVEKNMDYLSRLRGEQ